MQQNGTSEGSFQKVWIWQDFERWCSCCVILEPRATRLYQTKSWGSDLKAPVFSFVFTRTLWQTVLLRELFLFWPRQGSYGSVSFSRAQVSTRGAKDWTNNHYKSNRMTICASRPQISYDQHSRPQMYMYTCQHCRRIRVKSWSSLIGALNHILFEIRVQRGW